MACLGGIVQFLSMRPLHSYNQAVRLDAFLSHQNSTLAFAYWLWLSIVHHERVSLNALQ